MPDVPGLPHARALALVTCMVLVVLAAGSPGAAATPLPPPGELKYLCAGKTTGLLRPVAAKSSCRTTAETALTLPHDPPYTMCTRSTGFVRRASSTGRCLSGETKFDLPGTGPTYFCALPRLTYLRKVGASTTCGTGETALVVSVPKARADTYQLDEGGALSQAAPGVLGNDSDAHHDPLTATLVAGPAHAASFHLNANGSFTYTPTANWFGTEHFTYRAKDGTYRSTVATVTVTVRPVNDAPSFAEGPDQTVNQDSGAASVAGWATAISRGPSNEAGQALTFQVTADTNAGLFAAGPAVSSTGRLTFTPAAGASGTSDVTLVLEDDGGTAHGGADTSAPQTFTVTVVRNNGAPSAGADSFTALEDGALAPAAPGVLANDSDPDGDTMTASLVSGPEHAATFTLNADGSFAYTPDADFCGSDGFTYKAGDGTLQSAAATVSLTVTCVNDAPGFTKGGNQSVNQDSGPQTVSDWAGDVKAGPANESGQVLTFNVTGNTDAGLFAAGPAVSAAGTLTYTPKTGQSGTASVTIVLADDGGTADGGADTSGPQTFTITVVHVNAKPVAASDSYSLTEDGGATSVAAPGVLANDTDADGDALTAALGTGPAHAAAGFALAADGSFSYTPEPDFCGTDSFTYTASDGTESSTAATVTLNVGCVNDAPVVTSTAGNLGYTENDAPTAIDPGITVTDPEGDAITGATVAITGNASGADALALPAAGAITGSYAAGTLTLSGTATAADYQAALRSVTFANSSDTPSTAPRTVTFTVVDEHALPGSATRGVTVSAVNDPPAAVADTGSTDENTTLTVTAPGVLGNDTDPDTGDPKTVAKLNGSGTLSGTSAKGAAVVVAANGAWSYDPGVVFAALSDGETDTDTFTYTMTDGTAESTATVTVTVHGISAAPVAVADTFDAIGNTGLFAGTTPPAGQAGRVVTGSVLDNDTDADTPPAGRFVEAVTNAATNLGGTITMAPDGTFTYQPDDGDVGVTDTFTYRLCDTTPCTASAPRNVTGTLSLPITGQVWYVRNNQAAGGDGTSDTPFDTLAEAEAASGNGDTVYVFDGDDTATNLDTGYLMETNESLVGEAADLALDPDAGGPLPTSTLYSGAPANRPTLTASNEDVVVLASGARVVSLDVDPSGTGGGVSGGAVASPTVSDVRVLDTGTAGTQPGLELDGSTGTTNVSDLVVTNGGSAGAIGVRLNNAGTVQFASAGTTTVTTSGAKALDAAGTNLGSSTFDAITVTGSGTGGVRLSGTTGAVALGDGIGTDLSLSTTSGATPALDLANATGVTVPDAGTADVSATGGPAVDARNLTPTLPLDTVSATNSSGDGINLDTLGTGTFSATGGTVSGAAGIAFDLNGGSGGVSYAGAIADGTGSAVEVTGRTGGAVAFSGAVTDGGDAGGGIALSGNTGGSTTFSASKVLNTGASDAVSMTTSDGHTLSFTGGGLDVDTTSGRGLYALNSGTVTVTGPGNTLDSGTGAALSLTNTDIGAADLTLQSVSANGAANGVVLTNTGGAGGLTVTGNGGTCATAANACSGGTVQSTTGDAYALTSTAQVALTRVRIINNLGNGIRGATVTGFALTDSVVDNNADDPATDEAGLHLTELAGTASIVRTLVADSTEDNARIINSSVDLAQLDVTDSTFRDTDTASPGNNGLLLQADGTGDITADVTGSDFLRNRANGLQVITNGAGSMNVDVNDSAGQQSDFDDNNIGVNIAHNSSGTFKFSVRNITVDGLNVAAGTGGSASPINVNLASAATTPMEGTVAGNTLTNSNSSTGPGVRIIGNGAATLTVDVQDNVISSVANRGIEAIARDGSNTLNLTARNNTVTLTNALSADAIRADAGATSGDTTAVCADIAGNTVSTVSGAGVFGIRVRQRFAGTTYKLEGYAGGAADDAAVQTFLAAGNNSATTSADHAGAGFTATASCPMPSP